MTPGATNPSGITTPRVGSAYRWISHAVATTVAGVAGALQLLPHASTNRGKRPGRLARARVPTIVDGIGGRRSGLMPWTAIPIGTTRSLLARHTTMAASRPTGESRRQDTDGSRPQRWDDGDHIGVGAGDTGWYQADSRSGWSRRCLRSSSILCPWTITTMAALSAPVAIR